MQKLVISIIFHFFRFGASELSLASADTLGPNGVAWLWGPHLNDESDRQMRIPLGKNRSGRGNESLTSTRNWARCLVHYGG